MGDTDRVGCVSGLAAGWNARQFTGDRTCFLSRCLKILQHLRNVSVHLPEKPALLPDHAQLLFRQGNHALNAAWFRTAIRYTCGSTVEVNEFFNLPQREAKLLQLLDSLHDSDVLRDIRTIAGRGPRRGFQEFPALVEPDCSDLDASLL